jgi:hypothetical protein
LKIAHIFSPYWLILHLAASCFTSNGVAQIAGPLPHINWRQERVPIYSLADTGFQTVLFLEYAKATILNPEAWSLERRKGKIVYKIELVYTGYPRDTAAWLTSYQWLLQKRVKNLLSLAPELGAKAGSISWVLVEQTNCATAKAAQTFFHGFVLHYRTEEGAAVATLPGESESPLLQGFDEWEANDEDARDAPRGKKGRKTRASRKEKKSFSAYVSDYVAKNMKTVYDILADSADITNPLPGPEDTVQNSIDAFMVRRPGLKNTLVVTDWTGSMYSYGAQIIRWHRQSLHHDLIRAMVLTNDGDGFREFSRYLTVGGGSKLGSALLGPGTNTALLDFLEKRKNIIGNRGGLYFTDTLEIEYLLNLMEKAMQNGCGDEIPENNIEALLAATQKYTDFEHLVHIADNNAPVVDIALLDSLRHPVHIILCGKKNAPFMVDYLKIAAHTGGSVTTIESELDFNFGENVQFKRYPGVSGAPTETANLSVFELFCDLEKKHRITGIESPYFCALQAAREKYSAQIIGKTIDIFFATPPDSVKSLGITRDEVAPIDTFFSAALTQANIIADCTLSGIPYTLYFLGKSLGYKDKPFQSLFFLNGGDNFRRALLSSEKEAHQWLGYFNKIVSFSDRKLLKNQGAPAKYFPKEGVYAFEYLPSKESIKETLLKVALGGMGNGAKKNILEAILKSQMQNPADTLYLILDKQTEITDWKILPALEASVHIVACGPEAAALSPDLITLAQVTGGKLYTTEKTWDFRNPRWRNAHSLLLNARLYQKGREGRFRLSPAKPEEYIQKFIEQQTPVAYPTLFHFFEKIAQPRLNEAQKRTALKGILNRLLKQKKIQKNGNGSKAIYSSSNSSL